MADFSSFGKEVVLEIVDEGDKKRICTIYGDVICEKSRTRDARYQYQGFWYFSRAAVEGVLWVQHHFKPRKEDVILASFPKSGATWFKSLLFATMNRNQYDLSKHPLLTTVPHELVPSLEFYFLQEMAFPDPADSLSPPRLFNTHIPFTSLPQPVMDSHCRIIYVCREPKDVFVSCFFFQQIAREKYSRGPISIEAAFDQFCDGVYLYGPYWDHLLGYWKASLASPERVLFMKYEDMKKDSSFHLKKLAEFVGCPFSSEEESQGLVHKALNLCSFGNLSNLEVNKKGEVSLVGFNFENESFFRKGEIGDWKNHLTPQMADRLDRIIEEKLSGSGLTFSPSPHS